MFAPAISIHRDVPFKSCFGKWEHNENSAPCSSEQVHNVKQ